MQLLEIWRERKEAPEDPFKIRREVLWKNKEILIKGKEILYKKWYDSNIILLHDILKENGEFKKIDELKNDFGLTTTVMEYNALKSAIPASWRKETKNMKITKQAISNKKSSYVTCNDRTLALNVAENKDVYWDFVTKKITKSIVLKNGALNLNLKLKVQSGQVFLKPTH